MDSRTNGDAFSATPPESRYSKPEGPVDASVLIIAGRTYAESKVRSATKPGTGQEVWRIPDRERSSCYPTGIRRDANYGRWNLGRTCRSGRGHPGFAARCGIGHKFHRHRRFLWSWRE